VTDQIIRGESLSRLQHYASHHEFAPLWIGYSEDRRFTNRRLLVNNGFDFTGVDIFAAVFSCWIIEVGCNMNLSTS
jgi:hypothetical protein